jgi:hypothetical protein
MKLRLASIVLVTLALACSKKPAQSPDQIEPKIKAKAELYKRLHTGWAHRGGCDSLGFTSLCKMSGGCSEADIYKAEGEPGRWYRNESHQCYDLGQSKSDISKDMFIMLWPYLYLKGDKPALRRIWDYGQANGWVMGRGPLSRTYMVPPLVLVLQEMILRSYSDTVEPTIPSKAGYEKHLDVMAIFTRGIMRGGISEADYELLRVYGNESPDNALLKALYHKYKDGNQAETIAILLDEKLFPSDRLPTSKDRCEEYLWQRDPGSDWEPCDSNKIHDGVDFLFAAFVAGQI